MTRHTLLLLLLLSALGACKDTRTVARRGAPAQASAAQAARVPALPTTPAPTIENLDQVPAAASGRVEATVLAILENRTADFVDAVSTGGFTVGSLGLTKEQAEAELFGRTVAELTQIACTPACAWRVSAQGANELMLEARAEDKLVGAVVFVHEDDGSWGVARATSL